jgi:hypothetical protein
MIIRSCNPTCRGSGIEGQNSGLAFALLLPQDLHADGVQD